jgi:hypothetical protein
VVDSDPITPLLTLPEAILLTCDALTAFIFDPLDGMKVTTNAGRTYGDIRELDGAVWAGFTDAEVGYVIVNEHPGGAVRLWRTADAGAERSMISLP